MEISILGSKKTWNNVKCLLHIHPELKLTISSCPKRSRYKRSREKIRTQQLLIARTHLILRRGWRVGKRRRRRTDHRVSWKVGREAGGKISICFYNGVNDRVALSRYDNKRGIGSYSSQLAGSSSICLVLYTQTDSQPANCMQGQPHNCCCVFKIYRP
jgi:hypothetical protein